jgi:hypothetical protein
MLIEPQILGTPQSGFWTELRSGSDTLARQNSGGEFDLLLESGDHVDRQEVCTWRSTAFTQADGRLILTGTTHLPLFKTDLDVTITYENVTDQVIKKTIRLYQNNIPRLFLCLRNSFEPPEAPESYWSFDHLNHPGGPAYGVLGSDAFPAAGYQLSGNKLFGLLTDSGWENGWGRYSYRRSAAGNIPAVALVDPALLRIATTAERAAGKHFVALTLGEAFGNTRVPLDRSDAENSDREYIFLGRKDHTYTLFLEVYQARSLIFELRDVDGQAVFAQTVPLEAETANSSSQGWQSFVLRLPALQASGSYTLSISGGKGQVDLRRTQLFEVSPDPTPWHELRYGKALVKTLFLFADEMPATLHNLRLQSQLHLAEGLGFHGSMAEKVFFADAKMLTWSSEPGIAEPMVVPSIYYFEMYLRDAFWILNGLPDRFLNENILSRVGETINTHGNVGNIITAYHGSIEYNHNELAYLYLIWSLCNRQRFGSHPDMEKVRRVTGFIRCTFDPDGDGIVLVNNPQSSADVVWQNRPCRFAVSQGYYALALRVARELGVEIAESDIESAERAYRGYYADYGAEGMFLNSFPDNQLGEGGTPVGILSHVDLIPEFLSLYLFDHAMLTPEIVIATLEKYPISSEGLMPSFCLANGQFFTRDNNPFSGGLYWEPGTYWNGGSWLQMQYISLAVGKMHGWAKAEDLMRRRLDAELTFDPDNPVSREFLACNGNPQDSSIHRVFGWNVFILTVNEWLIRHNLEKNQISPPSDGEEHSPSVGCS